ncbi:ammonium transporter [Desulfitibacter alkalitolerans]|uniref:ammonium transporter n=1 Tax=Desulfitibacter alkalitolerans TaxID=264641 RepID=UPI0006880BCD|nr:ammonium transporter [Desulfitibacter alkalitolerans]
MLRNFKIFLNALLLVLLLSSFSAADSGEINEMRVALDTMFVLFAGFLVFFMHAGFAMLECGFTQAKNTVNILMKNISTISIGAMCFFLVGFGIMFGSSQFGFLGSDGFGLSFKGEVDFGIPIIAFWFFQAVFAATAATIVSGAIAERAKFSTYLVFTIVITSLIYPIVGHWTWGGGWLDQLGFMDFAGSTIVHSVGGWAALVGAFLLGPRIGKYTAAGKVNPIPGHNIPLGTLGVLLLWFGWFGFNPGSTLSPFDPGLGQVAANTLIAGAAGTISALIFTWIKYKKPDITLTLNGSLAGLVGITAGADALSIVGAILTGLIAGVILVIAVGLFDKMLKIDDPVGAISVHGVCGAFGTIAVGLFAVEGGLFYTGSLTLLSIQIIGVLAVMAWTVIVTFVVLTIIKGLIGLRVSEEEEVDGLDVSEHGAKAYNDIVGSPAYSTSITSDLANTSMTIKSI